MMPLLETYLKAIRRYLPSGPQQEDVLSELAEHLQSKIEEREASLGRRLTEVEQVALLKEYGNPLVVADRYGAPNRKNVAFGRQLIGPELFPLYAAILGFNWTLTLIALFVLTPFVERPILTFAGVAWRLLAQLAIVTVIFAFIDLFQRRSRARRGRESDANWRFPPAYLQMIPRWQSLSGLILFGVLALWWAAIPFAPVLMLGRGARLVAFTPSWSTLYWPVLAVLLVGAAQRAATFVRPEWNWLQSITRLSTNSAALALLFPLVRAYPYLAPVVGVADVAGAERLAQGISNAIWWLTVAGLSIYWLINAGYHAWLSGQHLRYELRRRTAAEAAR